MTNKTVLSDVDLAKLLVDEGVVDGVTTYDLRIARTAIQAVLQSPEIQKSDFIRFDYINADGNPDSKMITHDEMRSRYADLYNADTQQLRKDAERYQVLRNSDYQMLENDPCVADDCFNAFFGENLDAAVDALKARRDAAMEVKP